MNQQPDQYDNFPPTGPITAPFQSPLASDDATLNRKERLKAAAAQHRRFLLSLLPQKADLQAAGRSPGRDLIAGITVAIVALPLALAFGVASGLGAEAGLTTAIIAGILAAVFGGSNLQVSGPTGAMTVVLVPVVHKFGVDGVLQVGLMSGVMLLILAVTRVGSYVRLLPASLIEGFTAGIAVVIALQQFPNLFGVDSGQHERVLDTAWASVLAFIEDPDPVPVIIGLSVTAVILIGARIKPALPTSLLAIILVSALVWFFNIETPVIGQLPAGLAEPSLGFFELGRIGELLPSAFAVTALAALESLLCATVADSMSVGERHNPDRELLGQGIANLVVPVFGGVPATAAIARTAVNVRAGARSRLASVTHSLVLLAVVLALAPIVGTIPLAALAGVLLATTVQMIDFSGLRALARATRGDAVVLVLTFIVTVAVDLITAVVIGLGVAAMIALRAVSQSAHLERTELAPATHSSTDTEWVAEQKLIDEKIVAYRFDGPLFFGAAHRFLMELLEVSEVAVVILRLSRLTTLDATGALVIDDAVKQLEKRGILVLVSGIKPGHSQVLQRLGSAPHLRSQGRVFTETPDAIAWARAHIAKQREEP